VSSLPLIPSIPSLHFLSLHPAISPLPFIPFLSLLMQCLAFRIPFHSDLLAKVRERITDLDFPVFGHQNYLPTSSFFPLFYRDISSQTPKASHSLLSHKEFGGTHLFEMEFQSQFPVDDLCNDDDVCVLFFDFYSVLFYFFF
jgi:hypothetical protein